MQISKLIPPEVQQEQAEMMNSNYSQQVLDLATLSSEIIISSAQQTLLSEVPLYL